MKVDREITFNSVAELYNYIKDTPSSNHSASYECTPEFCSFTFEEALSMLTGGWKDGVRDVSIRADKLKHGMQISDEGIDYSLSGDYVDIGRYINGNPECFGVFVDEEIPKRNVNIVVNVSYSWTISQERIYNRGAVITALIDELIQTHFVNLTFVDLSKNMPDAGKTLRINLNVDTQNDYSHDLVAFLCANSAYVRRILFAVDERLYKKKDLSNWAYGTPFKYEEIAGGDNDAVVFDNIDYKTDDYNTIENSKEIINSILDNIHEKDIEYQKRESEAV